MRIASKATKGKGRKTWKKGESGSSNPALKKFRGKARTSLAAAAGDFSASLANTPAPSLADLTLSALATHNALNLEGLKLDDEMASEKNTINTFASVWSRCTNSHFERFLSTWSPRSELHKEMLAVLGTATEMIQEKGGKQSTTEYFAVLMTMLEESQGTGDRLAAIVELLRLVVSKVNPAVLKHGFTRFVDILSSVLAHLRDKDKINIIRGLIHCTGVVMKSSDHQVWRERQNQVYLEQLTSIGVHSDPSVRKSVRKALFGIIVNNHHDNNRIAASTVASYCVKRMNDASVKDNVNTIVCLLALLKVVIAEVPYTILKSSFETILSFLTLANILVTCAGLKVINSVFSKASSSGLTEQMSLQMMNALFEFSPNSSDIDPACYWLSTTTNILLCLSPRTFADCSVRVIKSIITFLLSTSDQVHVSIVNNLASILDSCNDRQLDIEVITSISQVIDTTLDLKYSDAWEISLQLVSKKFQVFGKTYPLVCMETLKVLVGLRQTHQFSLYEEMDRAVGQAVATIGPQRVIQAIPLELNVERGKIETVWLLPIIRQHTSSTELSFFRVFFVPLGDNVKKLSMKLEKEDTETSTHLAMIYQQIWSLLPCFCESAIDLKESFPKVAETLGRRVKEDNSIRYAILSGLRVVCRCAANSADEETRVVISKYSKNFLPILLNLYTTEDDQINNDLRLSIFDTIECFLRITDPGKPVDLYNKTIERLQSAEMLFHQLAYLDLIRAYIPYLDDTSLQHVMSQVVTPLLTEKNPRLQKKGYRIIEEVCKSSSAPSMEFVQKHLEELLGVILTGIEKAPAPAVSAPLNALRHVISKYFSILPGQIDIVLSKVVPLIFKCLQINTTRASKACIELFQTLTTAAFSTDSGTLAVKSQLLSYLQDEGHSVKALLVISSLFNLLLSKITDNELKQLLAIIYRTSNSRPKVRAVVSFSKILLQKKGRDEALPLVSFITDWLSELKMHLKKGCRVELRSLMAKMIRLFGNDLISKMISADLSKVLRNVRKREARRGRKRKLSETDDDEGDRETVFTESLGHESSGDEDYEDEGDELVKRPRQGKVVIEENMDDFDLLDKQLKKPVKPRKVVKEKSDDSDDEIRISFDGKIIISDKSFPGKKGKREKDAMEEDEDEDIPEQSPSEPVYQGSLKYRTGGKGIHRTMNKDELKTGREFRSKKGKGDVKKKGQAVDPYAYYPLLRSSLNRRKKQLAKGQFKQLTTKKKTRK